ncbi:hypothetical protein DID88_003915 [Monilinia fructigena]|uniref:Fe2OG dioxygenase domain-containing protein n=1 Tax=Monilinia fructigena TaxID=38457 RepID=A0A395IT69_9HELO|nr:hypothetical protein DID88_003915 [Monilinia fructigena]
MTTNSTSFINPIPLVDFSLFLHPTSTASRLETAKALVDACRRIGFVYIINHDISSSLLEEAFAITKKLFDLSHEEKMQAEHPPGPTVHRGYSYPGLELQDPSLIANFHSGHGNQLRLLHYPPIPASEVEKGLAVRMPPHSDWGSITMVFQDECGGLEIEHPERPGEFIRADPVKDAIVMNVGDLLMRWSNDDLKSTLHRVELPPLASRYTLSEEEERITRARYSIPYFCAPDIDKLIEVLEECVKDGEEVKYEPIVAGDYFRMRGALQYQS